MSPTHHPTGIRPSPHMASIPMVRVVFRRRTTDVTLLSGSPSRNLYTWDSLLERLARLFGLRSQPLKEPFFGTTAILAGSRSSNYRKGSSRSQGK